MGDLKRFMYLVCAIVLKLFLKDFGQLQKRALQKHYCKGLFFLSHLFHLQRKHFI